MTAERWQAFERYAAWIRSKPTWDAEERQPRLEVAVALRAAIDAAAAGGDWQPGLLEAVTVAGRRRADLTLRSQTTWLAEWLESGDPGLEEAVAAFAGGDSPDERFTGFARAADAAGRAAGNEIHVMAVGSLLNFAMDPERMPFVLRPPFRRLEESLDGSPHAADSITDEYAAHRDFAAKVAGVLGEVAEDMLDVQALVFSAARNAGFWSTLRGVGPEAPVPSREAPHYLAVCAIYRDEASYMKEWIEFHRLVGVERFYLYDNRSADDHREVLAPYAERGEVVVQHVADHDWPTETPQLAAYNHCISEHAADTRWIAFIDLDEFLFSPTGNSLPEVLRDYERWPGVGVNWAVFGSSGHVTRPPGLVTESYVDRLHSSENQGIKCVVDPVRLAPEGASIHKFTYAELGAVDENEYPITAGFTKSVSRTRLQVNHYVTKSLEEYKLRSQRPRPAPWSPTEPYRRFFNPEMLAIREKLGERDEAILQYLPALRQALGLTAV